MYQFDIKKAYRFTRFVVIILALLTLALVPVFSAVQPPVEGAASSYNAQTHDLAAAFCVNWGVIDKCAPIETYGYAWNG